MAPKTKPPSQTQRPQAKPKAAAARPRTVRLDSDGPSTSSSQNALKMTRLDPLTAFSQLSSQNGSTRKSSSPGLSLSSQSQSQNLKGKGKAKETTGISTPPSALPTEIDDTLWVDKYEPTTEAQLAVHTRKVEDVRRWLADAFDGGPSGKLTKYRRILALTGPAGTGKTATIRVLAKEMGFEILEWRNTIAETPSIPFAHRDEFLYPSNSEDFQPAFDSDYEGLFTKFEAFLTRASTCQTIFTSSNPTNSTSSTQAQTQNPPQSSSSSTSTSKPTPSNRRLILLEDLPNILHPQTQSQFHAALTSLVSSSPSNPPTPLVIIVSDAGMRGEVGDERSAGGGGGGEGNWGGRDKVVDIRTVLPRELVGGPYVTEIGFNPIAPTLLRKALQNMLNTHFSSDNNTNGNSTAPSKEILDIIVDSANGDIRSAIMALQFACITEASSSTSGQKSKKKGGKKGGKGASVVMEAITRREQSLALFHLLGKVLYNKRKDDPPNSSASSKDIQKEREADSLLADPPPLPEHLKHHERRTSRVNVDTLYADSPIDTSLFGLYIHQNYTQFCNDVEQSEDIAEWLSWIDSSGGEKWYHTNPHQFHLLTLGTLHSLPSPVPRRSQKYYKPEFFAYLTKEKEAWEGVRATRDWLAESQLGKDHSAWRAGGWSKSEIILELGGLLKAQDVSHSLAANHKPPPMHRLFSRMEFTRSTSGSSKQLDEKGDGIDADQGINDEGRDLDVFSPSASTQDSTREDKGGWLESDDIDEF